MAGRISGLKRGKRKGWDQRTSSAKGEECWGRGLVVEGLGAALKLKERELRAAVLRAWRDVVRLDLKLDLGLDGVVRRFEGGEMVKE